MSKKLMYYLFGLAVGLIGYYMFFKTKDSSLKTVEIPTKSLPANLNVAFECKDFGTEDLPRTVVNCIINNKNYFVDTVTQAKVLMKDELERHTIPKTALAACGGWFAGAGDYFYIVRENDVLNIYKGWIAEEQTDEGYHYEKVKTITAGDF